MKKFKWNWLIYLLLQKYCSSAIYLYPNLSFTGGQLLSQWCLDTFVYETRSVTSPRKKKAKKMQNINSSPVRKTNHFNKVSFLIGIGCLIGTSTTEISASSEPTIEAVAVVEVVSGFKNTYNVGLSFADSPTCVAQIRQLNLVLNNLKAQGVILIDRPVEMTCERSSMLTLK